MTDPVVDSEKALLFPGEAALYNKSSRLGELASQPSFATIGKFVTAVFLFWVGVEIDNNAAAGLLEAHPIFIVMTLLFLIFFFVEAVVRILALRRKREIWRCPGLTLDIVLVVLLLFRFNAGRYISLVRFSQLGWLLQLTRALRLYPDPMAYTREPPIQGNTDMLKRLALAVASTCLFLMMQVYLLTLAIMILATDILQEDGSVLADMYFPTVPSGMQSMLIDGSDFPNHDGFLGILSFVLYLLFVLLCIASFVSLGGYAWWLHGKRSTPVERTSIAGDVKIEDDTA